MLHRVLFRHGALVAVLAACVLLAVGLVILRTSTVSAQIGLSISKAADRVNVYPGQVVTYTIVFTNSGPGSAAAVMTDVIPFGVNYVTGSATGGATYVPGPPTAYVSWSGTLNPGEEVTVTFRALVVEPGTLGPLPIVNRAQINDTWSNPVTIYSARGVLTISKAVDRVSVHPGEQVTYTIVFTNAGPGSTAAVMTDVIPFGVNYVAGSATGGATYVPGSSAYVSWSGTLNPGDVVTVTFRALVVEPETLGPYPILNRAQINGAWSNPVTIYSTRGLCYLPLVTRNYAPSPVWPWGDD